MLAYLTCHDTHVSTPTPAEVLGSMVTAIDHVGLAVQDLDAAIDIAKNFTTSFLVVK